MECRAYAKNIDISGPRMIGSVRFEILIDTSVGGMSHSAAPTASQPLSPIFTRTLVMLSAMAAFAIVP